MTLYLSKISVDTQEAEQHHKNMLPPALFVVVTMVIGLFVGVSVHGSMTGDICGAAMLIMGLLGLLCVN